MSETMRKRSEIDAGRREQLTLGLTAACSVALSGGVIASLIYLLLALASLMAAPLAFAQTAPVGAGVRLEAGIEKEDVDGDLKSAMDIYQKIASDMSAPRDVRAKALLRLAGCDEKLGRQAKEVYEQITHDYADQPAAAEAHKRLALLRQQDRPAPPQSMTVRKIENERFGRLGAMDTDGQRATFMTPDGNIYIGDLAGHTRHLVLKGDPDIPGQTGFLVSRDFSMMALLLAPKPDRPPTVAVIKTDGTGYRELVRDDAEGNILGGNINFWMSWSWDDRNLLIFSGYGGKGSDHLWVVSVADGQRRDLLHPDGIPVNARFSPDGHYVAYEVWPKGAVSAASSSRIFVVSLQGGEPHLAFESEPRATEARFVTLKDWTADGRFLAIKDVRHGKPALYLLPMRNGVAAGPAEFVRYGDFNIASTTTSGALVYEERGTKPVEVSAYVASLGADGIIGSWTKLELRSTLGPDDRAPVSFSPNGGQIAYQAADADPGVQDIILRDLSTGRERVLYQSTAKSLRCQFSAHDPKVFCTQSVDDGGEAKAELISVAADSGSVEKAQHLRNRGSFSKLPWMTGPFIFRRILLAWHPSCVGIGLRVRRALCRPSQNTRDSRRHPPMAVGSPGCWTEPCRSSRPRAASGDLSHREPQSSCRQKQHRMANGSSTTPSIRRVSPHSFEFPLTEEIRNGSGTTPSPTFRVPHCA